MKIVGSRRGRPLLPLFAQWIVFGASVIWAVSAAVPWLVGARDAYRHEHARLAMLSLAVTLMAAAGLARRNRSLHVGLFVSGGVCLAIAALLRLRA